MLPATPAAKRSRACSSSWPASVHVVCAASSCWAAARDVEERRAHVVSRPGLGSRRARPGAAAAPRRLRSARLRAAAHRRSARAPWRRPVGRRALRTRSGRWRRSRRRGAADGSELRRRGASRGLGGGRGARAPRGNRRAIRRRVCERALERDVGERRVRNLVGQRERLPGGRPIARASCSFDFSKSFSATISRWR